MREGRLERRQQVQCQAVLQSELRKQRAVEEVTAGGLSVCGRS